MRSLADHIGVNWIKWILGIVVAILMAFNTYIVNKVDAIEKGSVKKEDYKLAVLELKESIKYLDKKIDAILIKNSINPDDIIKGN